MEGKLNYWVRREKERKRRKEGKSPKRYYGFDDSTYQTKRKISPRQIQRHQKTSSEPKPKQAHVVGLVHMLARIIQVPANFSLFSPI